MTGAPPPEDLRSFGRRRGRRPSERQSRLLREVLPRVVVDLSAPSGRLAAGESEGATKIAPCGRLPAGESQGAGEEESPGANQYCLEIGFGGGEHLLWRARRTPHIHFIGCEPFEDGVVKVLSAIEGEGLANVRIHMGDARELLRRLPEASIARAFILFPDPWPKQRHRKRRLLNAATLSLLAHVMKPKAELRIATDIGDYARTILEAARCEPRFRWQADGPADWRAPPSDWLETRYEVKAGHEGRRRYYFRFFRG